MTGTQLFVVGLIAAALLAVAAIVAVAGRRGPATPGTIGRFDRRAVRKDRRRRSVEPAPTEEEPEAETDREAAAAVAVKPADPLLEREDVTSTEYDISRRKFLNRSLSSLWGIFLAQFAVAGLGFMWPRLGSGFGSPISVGKFTDLRAQIEQADGTAVPLFVASAQTWLVPFDEADQPGSSFEGLPVVASDGSGTGLMALWQKCVHLGCRVPSCVPSQGFECPCHGSKYNLAGEYEAGPAPRNMDRFGVTVDGSGELVVLTGDVFETPRAKNKTTLYPLGPFCV